MTDTAILERNAADAAATRRASARPTDDAAMLKAAANLTRDLNLPKPAIYWADMLGSALLGYAALVAAMLIAPTWLAVGAGLVAVLALYRAGSFIHELTHIKKGAVTLIGSPSFSHRCATRVRTWLRNMTPDATPMKIRK
jgi:hypothetical protein